MAEHIQNEPPATLPGFSGMYIRKASDIPRETSLPSPAYSDPPPVTPFPRYLVQKVRIPFWVLLRSGCLFRPYITVFKPALGICMPDT